MSELTYFAQIDSNKVCLQVHVVTQQFIDENPDRYPGTWVETFYNNPDKTYAGEGYIYDEDLSDFVAPEVVEVPLP